jgi:hypothetical protein
MSFIVGLILFVGLVGWLDTTLPWRATAGGRWSPGTSD